MFKIFWAGFIRRLMLAENFFVQSNDPIEENI